MNWRLVKWIGLGAPALFAIIFAGWIFTLPPAASFAAAPQIAKEEAEATIAALKPPKRQRPLIAIIGINDATETTDYLMPYGILRRADVADVVTLATNPGPMSLFPVLKVEPQATIADFDAQHPDGADYVIVPAMSRDDDPSALQWIRSQAAKGAIVIGVCAGAKVVGDAGLLHGKRATTHWYSLQELQGKHPSIRYVANRRLVVDGAVATTTGISASMPMSLTLIEAIAGRAKAEAVGRDIGLADWDARHDSNAFQFTRPFALTAMRNVMAFWNREHLGIELSPGVDEVSLALVADAWSRTYRSRAVIFAASAGALATRNGISIVPDEVAATWPAERRLPDIGVSPPAKALDQTLAAIEARYGMPTADFVAMQLEYPRHGARVEMGRAAAPSLGQNRLP
ncbi:DJ-1/PfpI family protein [Bradyrhizobium sp. AUGA SZCCT0222]|uniref:DJ-1/PfpI family protein n=1 Tax=Bradyrhizobium sp. AUGA SZCCT0222 TaxID=2807668 RepID=UPI001BAE4619|nr:DJ-1/PfpI family protein [Bradyrhizobium sp. AUGA SZCCT0222]MBR1267551.1 DJ-1/PfpI family protein [Bradyrhizobium sp. AUGA SZCCT0222]